MYDPDQQKTIAKLLDLFGEEECLRCGFLGKDDNQTLFLTIIGTGYLLEIVAAGVETPMPPVISKATRRQKTDFKTPE